MTDCYENTPDGYLVVKCFGLGKIDISVFYELSYIA